MKPQGSTIPAGGKSSRRNPDKPLKGNGIRDWPESERPRERLLTQGPQALTDAQLVAILLRTGGSGQSALDVARSLLQAYGGIRDLGTAAPWELCRHPGVGPAKAAQLLAACGRELGPLDDDLARGDLSRILTWLRAHIHGLGCRYGFHELIRKATGAPLGVAAFLDQAQRRYGVGRIEPAEEVR